jgi:uncharacterized membrane protein YqaE (UPF0057 family)
MLRNYTLLFLLLVFVGSTNAAIVVPTTPATTTESKITTEAEALAAAKAYRTSIKEMSGKERRQLKREQRRAIKEAINNHQGESGISTLVLVIVTIILPPLGMFLHQGEINSKFWISLLLTILLYLPGLIYTLLTILG